MKTLTRYAGVVRDFFAVLSMAWAAVCDTLNGRYDDRDIPKA